MKRPHPTPPARATLLPTLTVTAWHAPGTDAYRRLGPHEYATDDTGARFWLQSVLVRTSPAKLFTDWQATSDRMRRRWWREACHTLLEWRWPSPDGRDDRIEFFDYDPDGNPRHAYEIDGQPTGPEWKSVTTLIHDAFPHFDRTDALVKALDSKRTATKQKYTVEKSEAEIRQEHQLLRGVTLSRDEIRAGGRPEYRWMRPSEMVAAWDAKGARASAHGTDMHFNLECALNGLPHATNVPEWDLYVRWKATHPDWVPFRTELCLFSKKPQSVAGVGTPAADYLRTMGQVDNLWWDPTDDGGFLPGGRPRYLYMTDWKFSEEIKRENTWESGITFFTADMPSCNGSVYGLQQPLYRLLLQLHGGGQVVRSCSIVVLHRDQAEPLEIPLELEPERLAGLVAWRQAVLVAHDHARLYARMLRDLLKGNLQQVYALEAAHASLREARGEDTGTEPPGRTDRTLAAPALQTAFQALVAELGREELLFDPGRFPLDDDPPAPETQY